MRHVKHICTPPPSTERFKGFRHPLPSEVQKCLISPPPTHNEWTLNNNYFHFKCDAFLHVFPFFFFFFLITEQCDAGFEPVGNVDCQACHRKYYKDKFNAQSCEMCPAGKTTIGTGSKNSSYCIGQYLQLIILLLFTLQHFIAHINSPNHMIFSSAI